MTHRPPPSVYPPPDHVLQDLGIEFQDLRVDDETRARLEGRLCIASTQLGHGDILQTGLLATAVDLMAGRLARQLVAPDWVATAHLELHTLAPPIRAVYSVTGLTLRRGKGHIVTAIDIVNGAGDAVAQSTITYARLPADNLRQPSEHSSLRPPDGASAARETESNVLDRIGVRSHPGGPELRLHDYIRNSLGGLQGGMSALLVDLACEQESGGHPTIDLSLHYLNVGRTGPFQARPRLMRQIGESRLIGVEVIDAGQDRLVATGCGHVRCRP